MNIVISAALHIAPGSLLHEHVPLRSPDRAVCGILVEEPLWTETVIFTHGPANVAGIYGKHASEVSRS